MKNEKFVKNLSNRQPTKDITLDDRKNKLKLSTLKRKFNKIDNNTVLWENYSYNYGPNGVESLEPMRNVAKVLKKNNINLIRGHAYKPLTFPYRSKQYSETKPGNEWMDIIKDEYNLK